MHAVRCYARDRPALRQRMPASSGFTPPPSCVEWKWQHRHAMPRLAPHPLRLHLVHHRTDRPCPQHWLPSSAVERRLSSAPCKACRYACLPAACGCTRRAARPPLPAPCLAVFGPAPPALIAVDDDDVGALCCSEHFWRRYDIHTMERRDCMWAHFIHDIGAPPQT